MENLTIKTCFFILTLMLSRLYGHGQDSILNKNYAIQIYHPDSLNDDIYRAIAPYNLIMIGEMHGTREPAGFVLSLATLLTKNGNHVQVGMEIPADQMGNYLSIHSDSSIYHSDFFTMSRSDNRASFAWANLIAGINNNADAEIFFFDLNAGELKSVNKRDSLMYLKIKNRILLHPSWKTIVLSGNIHNRLLPYEGEPKMGMYLIRDHDLKMADKILSINHLYPNGHTNSFFEKNVGFENYLYLYPRGANLNFSGIYFTGKFTFSAPVAN